MLKKDLNNQKSVSTMVVRGTLTTEQLKALDSLIGSIGSNRQDVVGKILTIWLFNEGFCGKNINLNAKQ